MTVLYCDHLTPGDIAHYGMGWPLAGGYYAILCANCTERNARYAGIGLLSESKGEA